MPHPLELSYNWRLPVTFSTIGLALCLGVLIPGDDPGEARVAIVLVLLWAALVVLVWLRTRAFLMVDGPRAAVRSAFARREVEASQVAAVAQHRTLHGSSHRLTVRTRDGAAAQVRVPTALLRGGEQTLFGWILTWAPQAVLDLGSQQTVTRLRDRGLLR